MAKSTLSIRQRQGLALQPSVQIALSMLRLTGMDLVGQLQREAEENPLLELTEPVGPGPDRFRPSAFDIAKESIGQHVGLGEHLRQQIGLMTAPDEVIIAARAITWSLSEEGRLETELDDLAAELNLPDATVAAGLDLVQACDPAGVGHRSLEECLALQLVDAGIPRETADAALSVADTLLVRDWKSVTRKTGLDNDTARRIADLLPTLTPYPGLAFQAAPDTAPPDVMVEFTADKTPVITVLTGFYPGVRIEQSLADQIKAAGKPSKDLQQYALRAQDLIRALSFRNRTLLRITAEIVRHQSAFFEKGPGAMLPLSRRTVAEETELHPSTVGRAVVGKSLLYPGGILPMGAFFPAKLSTSTTDGVSSFAVQSRISEIVGAEQADHVLSDAEITSQLQNEGVDIARRTVAKYRRWLNIPTSYDRKRLLKADRMRVMKRP